MYYVKRTRIITMKLLTCKIVDFYPMEKALWQIVFFFFFLIYRSINFIAKIWKTELSFHVTHLWTHKWRRNEIMI